MKAKNTLNKDRPTRYDLSAKLLAIGELIKFRGGEPLLNEEMVNYGIGMILTDIAGEMGEGGQGTQRRRLGQSMSAGTAR